MVTTVPGTAKVPEVVIISSSSDGEAPSNGNNKAEVRAEDAESSSLESLEALDPQPSPPRTHEVANGNAIDGDIDLGVDIDVGLVLDGGDGNGNGNRNGYSGMQEVESQAQTEPEFTNPIQVTRPAPTSATPASEVRLSKEHSTAQMEMNLSKAPAPPPAWIQSTEEEEQGDSNGIDVGKVAHDGNASINIVVKGGESHGLTRDECTSGTHNSPPIRANGAPANEEERSKAESTAGPEMDMNVGDSPPETAATLTLTPPTPPMDNEGTENGMTSREAVAVDQVARETHKTHKNRTPLLSRPTRRPPPGPWPEASKERDEMETGTPMPLAPLSSGARALKTKKTPLSMPPSTPLNSKAAAASTDVPTRITEIIEDPPPPVPTIFSDVPAAARVPIPTISAAGPVDVYLNNSAPIPSSTAAYIWNAADAMRLRREYRLIGDWLGTLPKHTSQNQYLSVPLALSYDELYFGYTHGFLRVFNHTPHSYPPATQEDVAAFYQGREDDVERHISELAEHQSKQQLKRAAISAPDENSNGNGNGHRNGNRNKRQRMNTDGTDGDDSDDTRRTLTGKKRKRASARDDDKRDDTTVDSRRKAIRNNGGRRTFMGRVTGMVSSVFGSLFGGLFGGARNETEDEDTTNMEIEEDVSDEVSDGEREDAENGARIKIKEESEKRRRMREIQARASTVVVTACAADERFERFERVEWNGGDLPACDVSERRMKQRAAVFKDLYTRGYAMSCGAKFGADLLAYAGDPHLFHAALAVVVCTGGEAEVSMHELIAIGRLGDSTKKRTVLAFHEDGDGNGNDGVVKYVGVQWEENLP